SLRGDDRPICLCRRRRRCHTGRAGFRARGRQSRAHHRLDVRVWQPHRSQRQQKGRNLSLVPQTLSQDRQGGGSSGMKVPLVDWRGRYAVTRSKIRGAIEENLNVIPWKLLPTVSLLLFMPDESFGGGIREFYR